MRSAAPLTVGALIAIIVGVLVAIGALRPPAPTESQSPSAAISAPAPAQSQSASAAISAPAPSASSSTTQSPMPTIGANFENAVLGYRMAMPSSWRRSDCLSRIELTEPKHFGQDVFTWRTVAAERDVGVSGGAGSAGAFAWVVTVIVQSSEGLTGQQYAERSRGAPGETLQPLEIDGTPAVRARGGSGFELAYYVARNDRMYTFGFTSSPLARPAVADEATLDGMARSMRFIAPAPRPTPSARPALSVAAEAVVDQIAAAFTARDADGLRALITPRCWFNSGFSGSGGAAASGDQVAEGWRTRFARGLVVRVEARPIQFDPPMPGAYWVWSTWTEPAQPVTNVQLVIDQIDGRWYFIGALFNARR